MPSTERDRPGATPPQMRGADGAVCRFPMAPPRHFTYPALLLLVAEKPQHGYALVEELASLGYGPVSRPSVYRALADLEHDGLLDSWSAEPLAGSTRHMYGLTDAGRDRLCGWIDVIERERDVLDEVIERFGRWRHRSSGEGTHPDTTSTRPDRRRRAR